MSEPDDLKAVLGEELFAELDSLDLHVNDIPDIDEAKLMEIASRKYQAVIEFEGEQALDLVAALFHAAEERCEDCKETHHTLLRKRHRVNVAFNPSSRRAGGRK